MSSAVTEFACKVAESVIGVPYDLVLSSYVAQGTPDKDIENELQPYGIDPMTILAIITAIIQVMDLLKGGCNKPTEFAANARKRNPLLVPIFRSRVWLAAKKADYPRNPRELADALMDVAHSGGALKVSQVVQELEMI